MYAVWGKIYNRKFRGCKIQLRWAFLWFQGLKLFNSLGLGFKLKSEWVLEERLGAGLRREVRINQRMLITKEKFYQHRHYHYDTRTGLLIDCQNPPWALQHSFELTSKITWTLQQWKQKFPLRLFVVKTTKIHCFKVTRNYYGSKVPILSKWIDIKGEKKRNFRDKINIRYWENDCVIEHISVKSGHMKIVANAVT